MTGNGQSRAQSRVEKELLDDLKRVTGKQALLYRIADVAVERPDSTVREVLYPAVGEQAFKDLVREAKAIGPTHRTTLRSTIRSSYRGHYRRAVLDLLAALDFRSNNEAHHSMTKTLDEPPLVLPAAPLLRTWIHDEESAALSS